MKLELKFFTSSAFSFPIASDLFAGNIATGGESLAKASRSFAKDP